MSPWFRDARDAKALSLDWKSIPEQDCDSEFVKRRFSQYIASKIETATIAGCDVVVISPPSFLYGNNNIETWFMQHDGEDILPEIADELRERGYRVRENEGFYLLDIRW